jgi:hypothetical protein
MVQYPKAPLFNNHRHTDSIRLGYDVALGEYFPTFQGNAVLSYWGPSTPRDKGVECLIQMETQRYFETSGNDYRHISNGKGKDHPRTGHGGPEGDQRYSSTHSLTSPRFGGWRVRGSNTGGSEIFRTRPDRPWGPPSVLYNGYRVFPRAREVGAWY